MEAPHYRDNLESVLAYTGGAHVLTKSQVCDYTGIRDIRTISKRYPYFVNGYISAETLARCLCDPPSGRRRRK